MDLKELKTSTRYINILKQNDINNLKDFFLFFPRDYEDRTQINNLSQLKIDWTTQTTKWEIIWKNMTKTPRWKKLIDIKFKDEDEVVWNINILHNTYYLKFIQVGKVYTIIWKPKIQAWKIIFWNPQIVESENARSQTWRIFPLYSELMWIKPNRFAKKMRENKENIKKLFEENLPDWLLEKYWLYNIQEAIEKIHFPQNHEHIKKAKYRIYFEKMLKLQLISIIWRRKYKENSKNSQDQPSWEIVKEFTKNLDFELTKPQKIAIKEWIEDIESWKPMMRLLQWDVWSWKTIVAACIWYYVWKKFWKQIAFLAPTEVLAHQHFLNLNKILLPFWVKIQLLVWATTQKNKTKIKQDIQNWNTNIAVGTTALIQEDIQFFDLFYVVIDEQHKFWVKQRWYLKKFGNPHILQMTATPIPRSLTLAFFGEFDVSTINELPKWRKPIYTKIMKEEELKKIKPWIISKIQQWQQVYIVTPLIEESENLDEIASATEEFEETKNLFNEIKNEIWLLHWKLKNKEKDEVMKDFKEWKTKILVTTTVIEVWVDVPQATIMIIKSSDRFWLSQLHQLRGRVWRSDIQSYCFLTTTSKSSNTIQRLKSMEKYSDWFKLSQIDLETRWSWEIMWTRQSWYADIPEKILTNTKFIEKTQKAAQELIEKNPDLKGLEIFKKQLKDENILI